MYKKYLLVTPVLAIVFTISVLAAPVKKLVSAHKSEENITQPVEIELWRAPSDIRHSNLYWGLGGARHAPHTKYTFI